MKLEINLPDDLAYHTAQLVQRVAEAMGEKLLKAEQKGRHGWEQPNWKEECSDQLFKHLNKGDPIDCMNFLAFMWHHGWPTGCNMMALPIKVFQVNDIDWWAGRTAAEVLLAYMNETGLSHDEATGDVLVMPQELTDKELDTLKFIGDEDEPLDEPITFRQQLQKMIDQGEEFPCTFATTEY